MIVLYAAYARMPTQKAHGIQVANMCAALGRIASVVLLVPQRDNDLAEPLYKYYGLQESFATVFVPAGPRKPQGRLMYRLGEFLFAAGVQAQLAHHAPDVVITRSAWVAWRCAKRVPVFYEMHDVPRRYRFVQRFLLRHVRGYISTNAWKAHELKAGVPGARVLVAPNGYRAEWFAQPQDKQELRAALGLPLNAYIVLYTGNVYGWKGVEVLARAAQLVPDMTFVFVGGTDEDAARFKRAHAEAKNIVQVAHQPHPRIPSYLRAADCLVLPNSASTEESRRSTSPLKLFEYLASGTPVAVADLPSVRELVDESQALFFAPDNPSALAQALALIRQDKEQALARAKAGAAHAQRYTWDARAQAILDFISGFATKG